MILNKPLNRRLKYCAKFDSKLFCHLIQIPAKQPVLLRIILHNKNPHDKLPVTLFQPVYHHVVRDYLIMNIHKGKDTVISYLCTTMDIGHFQIAILSH